MLRGIYLAETCARADRLRDGFAKWCRGKGRDAAAETLKRDWDRMTTNTWIRKRRDATSL